MTILENELVIELHSEEPNGKFAIKLFKEPNLQLQIENLDGKNNIFIDVDKEELNVLKLMIEKVIKPGKNGKNKILVPLVIPSEAEVKKAHLN